MLRWLATFRGHKQKRMALTIRGIVLVGTGVVFGLLLALGNTAWTAHMARAEVSAATIDPAVESAALVAEVIDRVRREYVDTLDDRKIVEGAIRGIVSELDQHSTFLDAEAYDDFGRLMHLMARAVKPLLAMEPPDPASLSPRGAVPLTSCAAL